MGPLQIPRPARSIYASVIALGVVPLCLVVWQRNDLLTWTAERALLAVALVGICALFQVFSFTIVLRGHRLALHPDEAALLLGFVVLPPPVVFLVAVTASVVGQVALRKPLVKAAFNVSAQSFATGVGALAFMIGRTQGLATLGAALLVPAAVSVTNQVLVAIFLTSLSGRRARDAWSPSLVTTISVASVTGMLVGVVVVALYHLHPVLTLAALPAWILLHRSFGSSVHTENELATRRALNALSTGLLDARDTGEVIGLALDAAAEAFAPSRRGAMYLGASFGDEDGAGAMTRIAVPLGAADPADGELWIELPARRPSEKERFATLLRLVANHASLALARIDAAKEAESQRQALARAERLSALGTLVAGVAHEVNNPLMYMGASIDLLEMDLSDVESAAQSHGVDLSEVDLGGARERIERVRTGVRRIQRVTKALGVVARQQRSPRRQVVRALDIAHEVEALVAPALREGVRLSVVGEPEAVLFGVPEEICHAVLAVVQNGVEALPEKGGHVRVSCRVVDNEVAILVEDNGVGMPEEVRRQAFTPFFTTKPEGTGLGLAGVLSIASAHGGGVRLDSEPDKGTRVELRLPRAYASPLVP